MLYFSHFLAAAISAAPPAIVDAKLNNKGLVVTLLDLRNAFGEVNHELIKASLKYHHVPDLFFDLFSNIYQYSRTAITFDNKWTQFLPCYKRCFARRSRFATFLQYMLQHSHDYVEGTRV